VITDRQLWKECCGDNDFVQFEVSSVGSDMLLFLLVGKWDEEQFKDLLLEKSVTI